MPDFLEQARRWSYDRQRLGRRSPDAEAALRAVVGVYSSHPSAPLSLHARAKDLTTKTFRRLDTERLALRLPSMRGSIHLLPRASAHLAFRAVPEPPSRLRQRLKYFGIPEERYPELREAVLAAAGEPRTARELGRELRETMGYEGGPTPVLSGVSRDGALLRVGAEGPRSNALRYVAARNWLGGNLPEADPDEALAWLAGEYLRAFGPARPEDFRWWAGVSKGRATAAFETMKTVEPVAGYLLPAEDREAFEAAVAIDPEAVDVLPKWDCYTMGYAADGRGRFVHPDVQGRVYTPVGDGLGVVLVGGVAAGAWEARFAGKVMEIRLDLFEHPGPRLKRTIEERFGEIAVFLGAREVRFTRSPAANRERAHPSRTRRAIEYPGEQHKRREGWGVRALRQAGRAADAASPRTQDAPQEQEKQKDLRPAGDPPHRRPLPALPPAHPHRPRQQRARTRLQHRRSLEKPPGRREVRRLDRQEAPRHGVKPPSRVRVERREIPATPTKRS